MSVTSLVSCDVDGCGAAVTASAGESWWARMAAENTGWSTGEYVDLCPTHRQDEEGDE